MIELPLQFANAIKDSPVTSLNCIVHIYKTASTNQPIQDQNINQDDVIRLSMGEFSLNAKNEDPNISADSYIYEPLLTKPPKIQNKIDIIKNKHTISSAQIRINNILYKGKVFSDRVREIWGRPCEIYFCSSNAEFMEDAMLIYTAVIKRYAQAEDHVDLILEDISTFKYDQKVPVYSFPDEEGVPDDMRGKSYPMVYGYNNQVPCVKYRVLNTEEDSWDFNRFIYESPYVDILGPINQPENPYDRNPYLKNASHPLNTYYLTEHCVYNGQEWPKNYLYAEVEGKLLPVQRQILADTKFNYYNGESVASSMTFGTVCYEQYPNLKNTLRFTNEYGIDLSQMLVGTPNYEGETFFLWSRIYRPITRIIFFDQGKRDYYPDPSFNDGDDEGMIISKTWFFGIGPERGNSETGLQWNRTCNQHLIDNGYIGAEAGDYFATWGNNWTGNATTSTFNQYFHNYNHGDKSWWFCSDMLYGRSYAQGEANSRISTKDMFWEAWGQKGEQNEFAGEFPVHYIQNGSDDYGMFCESNVFSTGDCYGYAKFYFDEHYVGSEIKAITKIYGKLEYNLDVAASSDWNLTEIDGGYYAGNIPYINHNTINAVGFMGFTKNDMPISEAVRYWNSTYYDEDSAALSRAWLYRYMDKNDVLKWYDEVPDNVFKGFGGGADSNENFRYNGWPYGPEHWESYGDPLQPSEDDTYVRNYMQQYSHWFDVDGTFDTLGKANYINWASPAQDNFNYNYMAWSKAFLQEFYMFQDVIIDNVDSTNFYVSIAGRIFNDDRDDFDENGNRLPIQTPDKILGHIFDEEIGQGTRWFDFSNIDPEFKSWRMNFVLAERTEFKRLVEDVFSQTLSNTRFEPNGTISFLSRKRYLKTGIENEENNFNFFTLDTDHVSKYKFDLTKSDDLYNSVNVKYDYDYVQKTTKYETGSALRSLDNTEAFATLDEFYREYYSESGTYADYLENHKIGKAYNMQRYYKQNENKVLEVTADKLQDEMSARKLQRKLLMWYCNQHLIVDLTLTNSYINVQVGDYFEFDQLLDNKKAFGFDYTKNVARNGQLIYNKFIVTETKKDGKNVKIKAMQVHRLELAFPDGFFDENVNYYDNGNIVDVNGNNLNFFFDINEGTVINPDQIDEDIVIEEDEFEGDYFKAKWIPEANSQDTEELKFTKGQPVTCVIDTDYFDDDSEVFYKLIFATTNYPISWLGQEFEADVLYGKNVTEDFDFNISTTADSYGRIMTISPREDNLLPHPDDTLSDIPDDLQIKMVLYVSTVSFDMTDPDIPFIDEMGEFAEQDDSET